MLEAVLIVMLRAEIIDSIPMDNLQECRRYQSLLSQHKREYTYRCIQIGEIND